MQTTRSPLPAGRTYAGLGPVERMARRRAAFLDAGLEVFGTSGFRTASVRGVCGEAGLATRYFYESFDNMEALLAAVFEECIEQFRGRLAATFGGAHVASDPEAMILAGLECFFDWAEDPRVARICWREVVGVSRPLDKLSGRALQGFAPMIVEVTRSIYPGLEIEDAEVELIAIAATGALSQAALRWHQDGRRLSRAAVLRATSRIMRGIMLTIEADLAERRSS